MAILVFFRVSSGAIKTKDKNMVTSEAQLGKDLFPLVWLLGALSFLQAARPKILRVLGAFSWRQPLVPCHVAFSIGQLKTWKFATVKPSRKRSSQQDRYYIVLCNVITYT